MYIHLIQFIGLLFCIIQNKWRTDISVTYPYPTISICIIDAYCMHKYGYAPP